MIKQIFIFGYAILGIWSGLAFADGDLSTKFTNRGGIGNTRHNMTQRQLSGGGPAGAIMDVYRNDYQEVCVYCHTPHGANTTTNAPLWNRTMKETTYLTYNQLNTSSLTQAVSQPGGSSLTCLSCHDGQTAVDSIINMPGSGRYDAAQATSQNDTFLNLWNNSRGPDAVIHIGLDPVAGAGCLACHAAGAGFVGSGATDFTVFAIGKDLTNDHPVGVTFPATSAATADFKKTNGQKGATFFFDLDGNGRMGAGDVRVYDNGGAAKVECASCHDPHGVPSAGAGSAFYPTFLRVANTGSALCLTCHTK